MYTVIVDEHERARMFENRINAVFRHCKVRVKFDKQKAAQHPFKFGPRPSRPSWPHDGTPLPQPQYMGKCGCKVGSVCNNVACPHRFVATCSAA